MQRQWPAQCVCRSKVRNNEQQWKEQAPRWGIDGCFVARSPKEKATLIEQLQAEGKLVCYIGNQVAEVMQKEAKLSISVSGLSQMMSDSADIILLDGSLKPLGSLFDLAH